MADVAVKIRKILEAIALAAIVCGILFFLREPLQVQFPLQLLSRGPDLLLQRYFAQQWMIAALVMVAAFCFGGTAPGRASATIAAQSSGDCPQLVCSRCPVEPGRLACRLSGRGSVAGHRIGEDGRITTAGDATNLPINASLTATRLS
jgi:hypothetical protein